MLSSFVEKQLKLLEEEHKEQIKQQKLLFLNVSHVKLQRNGLAFLNLKVNSSSTSFGGKM